jgi:hypothetical protein
MYQLMRTTLTVLLALHGLLHLLGFAKAFGLARLPQLEQPISRPMGVAWLAAALLLLATAVAVNVMPRWWWIPGIASLVLSQVVIVSSWSDARYGTLANALILIAVAIGFLSQGPTSLRAEYDREVERIVARAVPAAPALEGDLARLPAPVRRYILASGGAAPAVSRSFQARFRGRIRSGPEARWMPFTAEQVEAFDEPVRLFYMDATMFGVPLQVLHVFRGSTATMRVRAAGLLTLVDAKGPELDRAETVTLLNDMSVLAPGSLLDPRIRWQEIDDRSARATFTNGAQSVVADLIFGPDGLLADFASDDRRKASADGKTFEPMRWTTPVRDYRGFGPWRISTRAETMWHPRPGPFAYGEFELLDIVHDASAAERTRPSGPGAGPRAPRPPPPPAAG